MSEEGNVIENYGEGAVPMTAEIERRIKKALLFSNGELHTSVNGRLYIVTYQGFDEEELDNVYSITEINPEGEMLGVVTEKLCMYNLQSIPKVIEDYEKQ